MAAPVLDSLTPATVDISAGDTQTVTIAGSLFEVDSVVEVDGNAAATAAYVSDTEMTFEANTFYAPDNGVLQVAVRNGVEVSNALPLTLTGTTVVGDPNHIPDAPPTGASPNTPAVRAEYLPPDPPDVYQQADPVQFVQATKSGVPSPHIPEPEELPTTNANEDGGLPTNAREPYPSGNPRADTWAQVNGRA
jgi:hypothetical protein